MHGNNIPKCHAWGWGGGGGGWSRRGSSRVGVWLTCFVHIKSIHTHSVLPDAVVADGIVAFD